MLRFKKPLKKCFGGQDLYSLIQWFKVFFKFGSTMIVIIIAHMFPWELASTCIAFCDKQKIIFIFAKSSFFGSNCIIEGFSKNNRR